MVSGWVGGALICLPRHRSPPRLVCRQADGYSHLSPSCSHSTPITSYHHPPTSRPVHAHPTHRSASPGLGSSIGTATPNPAVVRLVMGADMRRTGT